MAFCTSCGEALKAGAQFCTACGAATAGTQPPTPRSAQAGPADAPTSVRPAPPNPPPPPPPPPPPTARLVSAPGPSALAAPAPLPPSSLGGGKRNAIIVGVVGAVVALIVVLLVVLHPWSSGSGTAGPNEGLGTAVAQTVPSPSGDDTGGQQGSGPSPSEEAQSFANILEQSGVLRRQLESAVGRLDRCDAPGQDVADLRGIRSGRADLLNETRDASISGLSGGAGLRNALASAMHFSVLADDAFIRWGQQIQSFGCGYRNGHSATLNAINRYDREATAAKQRVVRQWASIAAEFGLRYFSETQI